MNNARVIIVEDHPKTRSIYKENLDICGHVVVGEADTVAAAILMIDSLKAHRARVDVAIVDGSLSGDEADGTDGEVVAAYIHRMLGKVTIIGAILEGGVHGADINVSKQDPYELYETIQTLQEPAFKNKR